MLVIKKVSYGVSVMLEYIPVKKHKGGFIEYNVYRIDKNGQREYIYKECVDELARKDLQQGGGFYVWF